MDNDKLIHDWLLEHRPEGAEHDGSTCRHCANASPTQEEDVTTEQKIYTQEVMDSLVESAVEKALSEATVKSDAEVLRLNEELDTAQKEIAARDAKIEELTSELAERDEHDRLEAVAAERVELVQAAANFSDEQISNRREAWSKMSSDDFEAYLEDLRAISKAPATEEPKSKFEGTRATAGDKGSEKSVVSKFFETSLDLAGQM